MSQNSSYRQDIDGLRALSVLAVFLFHVKAFLLPGGFIGVDVFFVISGYLITSQIYREIQEGDFSLGTFYVRRLKRIQPVMWFVVLVTYIAALFIFIPRDLKFLADSIRSVLSLSTNLFFANNTDYFNPKTEESPLLHFWSLAVEEQFYLFWPLMLMALGRLKFKFKKVSLVIFILSISSFAGAEYFLQEGLYTKMVYYSLPSRIGELGLGGLLGIFHLSGVRTPGRWRSWISVLGLALLTYALCTIDQKSLFPGLTALLPCLAALFLIEAGPQAFINKNILSQSFVVQIGRLSYSIYLWHFPILAFMKYLGVKNLWFLSIDSLTLTILLSVFSKNQIEDRFRKLSLNFGQTFWRFALKPILIALVLVVVTFDSGGLPQRYILSKGDIKQDVAGTYEEFCHEQIVGDCKIGDRSKASEILVTGDSHAGHMIPFWDRIALSQKVAMTARSSSACLPVFEPMEGDLDICIKQKKWFKENYQKYKLIVMVARWDYYIDEKPHKDFLVSQLLSTLKTLTAEGIHVVVLLQLPKFEDDEYNTAIRQKYLFFGLNATGGELDKKFTRDPHIEPDNALVVSIVNDISSPLISLFNPMSLVPEMEQKLPYRKNGMAYTDANHINATAARTMADLFITKKLPIPIPFSDYRN